MTALSTTELVLRVVREGLLLVLLVSAPPLLVSVLVGLVMGVLQTATQIQDQSLGFVPKLVAVVLTLVAMGPLLGAQVLRFTEAVLTSIGHVR